MEKEKTEITQKPYTEFELHRGWNAVHKLKCSNIFPGLRYPTAPQQQEALEHMLL